MDKEHQKSREAHLMQQYATERRSGATQLKYQEWKKARLKLEELGRARINLNIIRTMLKDN